MSSALFDDLQPRQVFNRDRTPATVLVKDGDKMVEMEQWVGSGGSMMLRRPTPAPIDQTEPRKRVPVAERWAGIDQMQ